MTKIYLPTAPQGETFELDRSYKKRLTKVMRLGSGDAVEVFAPARHFQGKIMRVLPDGIEISIISELPAAPAPQVRMVLGQAVPKGDRFEWLIQKATELGVAEIYPLITERTIVRPSNAALKLQRWSEIAEHAAGQSENSCPAQIHAPVSVSQFLEICASGIRFLLYEEEGERLQTLLKKSSEKTYTFAVGPEGGWAKDEVDQFKKAGFTAVHLGERILRSETAGVVLAAIIQYELGDFS